MSRAVQIFLEYKVKEDSIKEYEKMMEDVLAGLEKFGASQVDWYEAADQGSLYVEMFKLPTMAHYDTIKKYRQDKDHPLFGKLDPFIEGGCKKVHCWAFIQKT